MEQLRLRAPANLVSRRAITLWTVSSVIWWTVLLIGGGVWWALSGDPSGWVRAVVVAVAVIGVVETVVVPRWRYRVHRWEVTPDAVFARSGWINQEWRIAPVSRIQTVDTSRGPLQQMLNLSTVTVTTASAAGPVKIENLDADVAARLTDELARTTQAVPGDAT